MDNGDFEDYSGGQFDGWTAVGITGNPVLEEFDTWDGYGAFYVDEGTAGGHYLRRTISGLVPDETYLLTAKVKAKGVSSSSCGAAVKLGNPNISGACDTTQPVTGTQEWTLVQVAFRATDDEYQINVGLFGASGEAWFDDVRIIRINGLLKNPDLERGVQGVPTGWSPTDWTTGVGNATYESGNPLTGVRSLKVIATVGNNYKYQTVDIAGGEISGQLRSLRDYIYTAYVKTENLTGDGAYIQVNKDGNGYNYDSVKVNGTEDWTELNVEFTPVLTNDYEFRLVVNGSGTAYFDRARLERRVISDPGFDLGLYDPEYPSGLGTEPWEADQQHEDNEVEVVDEGGNDVLKVYYHGSREDFYPPRGYQEVELFKGCDYRITWRGSATVAAGPYVAVKVGTKELYRRDFSTGPAFVEFEGFFYVPPGTLGVSDSYDAEVTLSLENDGNTVYFDDVFIEKVSERPDANPVTVIPQPQAVVDLGFDTEPIKATSPGAWKIYHTYLASWPPGKWQSICSRLSDDLETEFDIGPLGVYSLTSSWTRPAIIIGDVNKGDATFDSILEDLGGVSDYVTGNDEGYEMFVDRDLIVIAAEEPNGAFYGAQTLLHYLKEVPNRSYYPDHDDDRVAYVPCGHIYDWPDMPLRGTMAQIFEQVEVETEDDNGKLNLDWWKTYKDWIRFLASMKVNALLLPGQYPALEKESDCPAGFLAEMGESVSPVANWKAYSWLFDECRNNFIEPIPHFGPMGTAAGAFLAYYPHGAEGRFIGKTGIGNITYDTPDPQPPERINLSDDLWHPVAWPFIIKRYDDGLGGDFFKVEKYVGDEWVPATGKYWDDPSAADYSWEYVDLWYNNYDKKYYLESPTWHDQISFVVGNRNLRIKARDFDGLVRVFYTHVFYEGTSKRQSYCPSDPDVIDLYEDTIDEIFDYLNPIKYFGIDHSEVWRMHTCAKCYNAPGTMVGGKVVTPCGKLLGDDVDRYYDAITAAANEHQGGLQPDMFIWADCFSWTNNAITFGDASDGHLPQRNKYRNWYGYPSENLPDDDVVLNDIGVDSCRWLLQDHPRLVMMPWEYSINMLNVEGVVDVVTKWAMQDFAEEFLEGKPTLASYQWYGPPPYDDYPKYRLAGCPTGFPERFINYGRESEHKVTKYYQGRGGVYVGLQLLDDGDDVITKTTPSGVEETEEPILKTGQCIEGSLWHHVPDHLDEWPKYLGVQENWYYAEHNFKKLKKDDPGSFKSGKIYKEGYNEGHIDYARFRVHFDSLPYDQPDDTEVDFDFGSGGRVWCDDAEFERSIEGGPWDGVTGFEERRYFRNEGSGGKAFEYWDLTRTGEGDEDEVEEYYDTNVYRYVHTTKGTSSCRYDRSAVLSDEFYHSAVETDLEDFGVYNFDNTEFRVGLRVRAKYVDTYRLGNVWQWQYVLDRYDYLKYDPGRKTALGIVTYNSSRFVFYGHPEDSVPGWDFNRRHNIHTNVNGRAVDAAAAEWCWSLSKPRRWDNPASITVDEEIYDTPKLENLWYCPYYIHQRESTWFEKK